ncbi:MULTISPECIES: flagellar motor switch protein FliN [Spongiibacter]|jgi:flagellar motor switch protein FliN/FliY|uniref:flagellar motor switch protein FliN n=1 Tax=Spongiibacter TaxID=630749 RepID=UPI001961E399|nr:MULTISPECIES: flagellar motor switch protein FliN [Spongiibacter]MBM7423075.1 flagellar motor switch protein FliN/FliY [Spongiibacter marinus]MEE2653485.1 flagellar motor switch protein FliN [Pseudomonadota bacterium]|tara:strand:+ start:326 stop:715 length:390 start_codon:yes stop_codon:yes gene_type:complete
MTEPENLRREREMLRQQIEAEEGESSGASDLLGQARLRERTAAAPDLDMVMDIPVRVTLEVGGSDMAIRDLLQLQQGAVVELDRQAGEPLDVLVNGRLIARGEVVVVDDKLGIRLTEVVSATERLQSLR